MAIKYRKDSEVRLSVSELDGNFQYIEDELGNLSSDISQLEVIVESLDLAGLTASVIDLENDVIGLTLDVAGLTASVLGLEGDVAGLTLDVASATASIAILNTNLASVTASIATLTTLDVLKEFKPGSVGEKVSFTKVSGTNPATNKDVIIPGELEITRGASGGGGIYNIAVESSYSSGNDSPENTFWNTQYVDSTDTSWAPLWDVQNRSYTDWRDAANGPNDDPAPPQYVGMHAVMKWDNGDDEPRYWLIMFTEWGVGNNDEYGFAYDRWEILPAVEVSQPSSDNTNTPQVIDIISDGVHIAREYTGGQIYNIINEPEANGGVSPRNTKWNSSFIDSRPGYSGYDDLSNLESRVYTDFRNALDGSVGNNVLDTDLIMHDMTTDLYYKVQFTEWAQGCNSQPYSVAGAGGVINYDVTSSDSDYPDAGWYNDPWLILEAEGGSGSGFQIQLASFNGEITQIDVDSGGQNYQVGDVLTFPYSGVTNPYTIEVTEICSMGGFAYTRTVIPQSNGIKFADGTVMNTAHIGSTTENGVTGDFNLVFFNAIDSYFSTGTFSFTNGILATYSNIVPIDLGSIK